MTFFGKYLLMIEDFGQFLKTTGFCLLSTKIAIELKIKT